MLAFLNFYKCFFNGIVQACGLPI